MEKNVNAYRSYLSKYVLREQAAMAKKRQMRSHSFYRHPGMQSTSIRSVQWRSKCHKMDNKGNRPIMAIILTWLFQNVYSTHNSSQHLFVSVLQFSLLRPPQAFCYLTSQIQPNFVLISFRWKIWNVFSNKILQMNFSFPLFIIWVSFF